MLDIIISVSISVSVIFVVVAGGDVLQLDGVL